MQAIEIQEREMTLASLEWSDIEGLREQWTGRLLVRGLAGAADRSRTHLRPAGQTGESTC